MTNSEWKQDEGYSCCMTKRINEYALVICPPELPFTRSWGFQVFCEADDEAIEYGEYIFSMDGIWSEQAAMAIAEMYAAERL